MHSFGILATYLAIVVVHLPIAVHGEATNLVRRSSPTRTAVNESRCNSGFASLLSALPTPSPELTKAFDAVSVTNYGPFTDRSSICATASSLSMATDIAEYSSWNNEVYSYYSSKSSDVLSLASLCEDGPKATSQLQELLTAYSAFSVSGCSQTLNTATSSNVGPKETGKAMGLLAIGAFVGAAVCLE